MNYYKNEIIATSKRIRAVFKKLEQEKQKSMKIVSEKLAIQKEKMTVVADETPSEFKKTRTIPRTSVILKHTD